MNKLKQSFVFLIVVLMMLSMLSISSFAQASISVDTSYNSAENGVHTNTVSLVNARQNMRGDGYYWANRTDTLTISNLSIDTDMRYGLRVPDGATLVLEGKNVIRASHCALGVEGNLTITGSGTLTLISDDYGIILSSINKNQKIRFDSGKINIESAGTAVYSEYSYITQGEKAELSIKAGNGKYAIDAREIRLLGGKFTANAPIKADDIKLSEIKMSIEADRPCIEARKNLSFYSVGIKVGSTSDALADSDKYNGENVISTKIKREYRQKSLFWGDKVAGYWDFVTIGVAVLVVAAVIATPYIKNKRSIAAVDAAKARAREEEKQNRLQAQKENKDKQ